jgi:hypothetical protein
LTFHKAGFPQHLVHIPLERLKSDSEPR